ncbi:MAG: hypothetical protein HUJ76_09295, partial [Parasporobacterium sp.]|nr:hypothetical protein [Parasporobacterium sp.]
ENNVNLGKLSSFGGNAGLYAAACGAVLYTDVSSDNSAAASGTIKSLNKGSLYINADQVVRTTNDGNFVAVVPSVAVGGAVGAPVAILYVNASNAASSTGTVKDVADINITSDTKMELSPEAVGFVVGFAGGAGVAVVKADVTVNNTAFLSGNATASGDVNITAERRIVLKVINTALAGGIFAGVDGSISRLYLKGKSCAFIGNAKVAADTVRVVSRDFIYGEILSRGAHAAAGLAIGITSMDMDVSTETESFVDGADITADNLYVLALFNRNDDGTDAAFESDGKTVKYGFVSNGSSSGGGILAGGIGLYNVVKINPSVKAYAANTVGKNAVLDIKNSTVFKAVRGLILDVSNDNIDVSLGVSAGDVHYFIDVLGTVQASASADGLTVKTKDLYIIAGNKEKVTPKAKGNNYAGVAAGMGQYPHFTTDTHILAESGSTVNASGDVFISAANEADYNVKNEGSTAAAVAAPSFTTTTIDLKNDTEVVLKGVINAKNLDAEAVNNVKNIAYSAATAYAAVAAVSTVKETTNAKLGTLVKILGAKITTDNYMLALAKSDHKFDSVDTGKIGSLLLAFGTMKVYHDITDNVNIVIDGAELKSANGKVELYTQAFTDDKLKSEAGQGGLYSNVEYVADGKITQNSHVEFAGTGSKIEAKGDVAITTRTDTKGVAESVIDASVSVLDTINVIAKMNMAIDSAVIMCDKTSITSKSGDVYISAIVDKIYANTNSDGKTYSLIHLTLNPVSEIDIKVDARVVGQNLANVTLAALDGKLNITASLPVDSKLHVVTEAFGKQTGASGSIVSTSKNNVKAHATVNFTGTGSVFQGIYVYITASSPLEAQTEYEKKADYEAYTATELVKQVVKKTVQVVDVVVEKVSSWLPWPLDHVVKWVTKTIVRTVEIAEEVLVEKTLDSKTKAEKTGTYYSDITKNHVTLYGTIIYGSNTFDDIVVETDGTISDKAPVKWHKDEANKTVYIDSYDGKLKGQLIITAQDGTIDGEVTVHIQNMVENVTITNKSDYTLNIVDFDIYLHNNDSVKDYQLICSDHSNFITHDDTTNKIASKLFIFNEKGTDLYFSGDLEAFLSDVIIEWINEAGNMYITADALLRLGSLYVTGVNKIGSKSDIAAVQMFTSERTTDDGVLYTHYPNVEIAAEDDVNMAITLNKYIQTTAEDKAKVIEECKDVKSLFADFIYSENGNVNLVFNPVNLVLGLDKSEGGTETGSLKVTVIDDVNVVFTLVESVYEYVIYARYEDNEIKYYLDSNCTKEYSGEYKQHTVLYMLVDDSEYNDNEKYYYDALLTQKVNESVSPQIKDLDEAEQYLKKGNDETGYTYELYIQVEDGSEEDKDESIVNKFKILDDPEAEYDDEYFIIYIYDSETKTYREIGDDEEIVFGIANKDETGKITAVNEIGDDLEYVVYDYAYVCTDKEGNPYDFSKYEFYYISCVGDNEYTVTGYEYVIVPGGSSRIEEVYGISGTYSIGSINAGGDVNVSAAGRVERKDEEGKILEESTKTTIEIAGSVYSTKDEAVYTVMAFNNADVVFAESYGKYEIWIGSEDATVNIVADSISSK